MATLSSIKKLTPKKAAAEVKALWNTRSVASVVKALKAASHFYYNTDTPLMSDAEFDRMEKWLKKNDADNKYFTLTGAPPNKNEKFRLPISMPGLPILRPDDAKLILKGSAEPWLAMPKADGYAILSVYENGILSRCYTRGNGYMGRDITHLVKDVPGIKKRIKPLYAKTYIKQELIMHRETFDRLKLPASPRNVCSSIVVRNEPSDIAKYAVAVSYSFTGEVAGKRIITSIVDQFKKMMGSNLITIFNCFPIREKDVDKAVKANDDWKLPYPIKQSSLVPMEALTRISDNKVKAIIKQNEALGIDCDGIVIHRVVSKPSRDEVNLYKIKLDVQEQNTAEAVVGKIQWNVTSRKILPPVVILKEPVVVNGVKLSRFYADSAKFVKENKLCKGCRIEVVRSGDVIPRIVRVLGGQENFKGLPKQCPVCEATLTFNGTNLICQNKKCTADRVPRLVKFFTKLKIKDVRKGTLQALAEAGYYTIPSLLKITPKKIASLSGFGNKKAEAITKAIKEGTSKMTVVDLMAASDIFTSPTVSLSFTRLQPIVDAIGDKRILEEGISLADIEAIKGVGPDSALLFVNRLPYFQSFYKEIKSLISFREVKASSNKLQNMRFVFTQFRDEEIERIIIENGGTVGSLTKTAHTLYAADETTEKARKAKLYGIRIVPAEKAMDDIKRLVKGK